MQQLLKYVKKNDISDKRRYSDISFLLKCHPVIAMIKTLYRVSKKTLWKFNSLSCIIKVANERTVI
jgi:hypothetical protein